MEAEVRALERLVDSEGLRESVAATMGIAACSRSPDLLRCSIAWRIQAGTLGGLDADLGAGSLKSAGSEEQRIRL